MKCTQYRECIHQGLGKYLCFYCNNYTFLSHNCMAGINLFSHEHHKKVRYLVAHSTGLTRPLPNQTSPIRSLEPPSHGHTRPSTLHEHACTSPRCSPHTAAAAPPMIDSSGKITRIMHEAATCQTHCPHQDRQNQTSVPAHARGGHRPGRCKQRLQLLQDAALKRPTSLASLDYLYHDNASLLSRPQTTSLNKHLCNLRISLTCKHNHHSNNWRLNYTRISFWWILKDRFAYKLQKSEGSFIYYLLVFPDRHIEGSRPLLPLGQRGNMGVLVEMIGLYSHQLLGLFILRDIFWCVSKLKFCKNMLYQFGTVFFNFTYTSKFSLNKLMQNKTIFSDVRFKFIGIIHGMFWKEETRAT